MVRICAMADDLLEQQCLKEQTVTDEKKESLMRALAITIGIFAIAAFLYPTKCGWVVDGYCANSPGYFGGYEWQFSAPQVWGIVLGAVSFFLLLLRRR
jgi:hypothetical protein